MIDNPKITDSPQYCEERPVKIPLSSKFTRCKVARIAQEKIAAEERAYFEELRALLPGIEIFDSTPYLCGAESCEMFENGKPLYAYTDHLNQFGGEKIARPLVDFLEERLK